MKSILVEQDDLESQVHLSSALSHSVTLVASPCTYLSFLNCQ